MRGLRRPVDHDLPLWLGLVGGGIPAAHMLYLWVLSFVN